MKVTSGSSRVVAALALGYAGATVPYVILIRAAGRAHGQAALLPVFAAATAATLLVAGAALRLLGKLPRPRFNAAAVLTGIFSSAVIFGSFLAKTSAAPPVLSDLLAKVATLGVAALLDASRRRASRARGEDAPGPAWASLFAAGAAVAAGWWARGAGPLTFGAGALAAVAVYVAGWAGKLRWSGPWKGDAGFLLAEQVATACASAAVAAGVALTFGVGGAAWVDPRAWAAGVASQASGLLVTALVLLPASHGACVSLSRGASLAASVAAQVPEGVSAGEGFAALLGALAAGVSGRRAAREGNVSRRRTR